jgi:hypothetical protein
MPAVVNIAVIARAAEQENPAEGAEGAAQCDCRFPFRASSAPRFP